MSSFKWNFDVSQNADLFRVSISRKGGDRPFNLDRSCANMQQVIEVIRSCSGLIDVNAVDARGRTAMYVTCERGYHDLAELLLDMGASVNVRRTGRYSGSHNGYTALHAAARGGMVDAAKLLLSRGAEAGRFSATGYTPLHLACQYGHCQVAAEILDAGADVDAQTYYKKWTALHIAAEKNDEQMVELLLRRNADVHAVDCWRDTALLHQSFPGVTQLLLDNGANPSARGLCGMTPLHKAAARDQVETVRLLLDYGVDINERDYNGGRSPFHWACEGNSPNTAECLLKMGAPVNDVVVNPYVLASGMTALHLATLAPESKGRRLAKLFKLLFEWGADVNATDCHGRTPLVLGLSYYRHKSAIAEVFTKRLATMQALGLHVSETNLQAISDHATARNLSKACEAELQSMRRQEIGDSSVTFFDLLTKGPLRLADYAANADVVRVLKSGGFKKEFPLFAEDIRQKFVAGRERLRLHRESESVLRRGSFRYAPYSVLRRLDRYLTNEDLNQIIKAKD